MAQMSPYRLALERPPHNRAISHCELRKPVARKDPALGYVEGVHDGNDVVAARAGAFYILQ